MTDGEIRSLIHREIKAVLAPILMGMVVSNESNNRSTIRRVSEGPIGNLRNIQPFGISSRAPVGTSCLAIPIASDPTHINMVGHFDETRPTCNDGETIIYSSSGYKIKIIDGSIMIGKGDDLEPMVVGETLNNFLITLVNLIVSHGHTGNLGYLTGGPTNSGDFLNAKSTTLDSKKIETKDGGRY